MPEGVIPDVKQDDAQHAIITGVQLERKKDGRQNFLVKIASRDIHFMTTLEIGIPTAFEEHLTEGNKFDPSTLPEDDDNGRQQTLYRKSFGNRRNDAWLQRLVFNLNSLARLSGKDPKKQDIVPLKSLEDYAHNLHEMLSGVECILLRRRGEIWDILPDKDYSVTEKKMAGYKLLWERN